MGDMNARIQARTGDEENHIVGPHTLNSKNIKFTTQTECVLDSRQNLIDLCIDLEAQITNTFFEKPEHAKITYEEKNTDGSRN